MNIAADGLGILAIVAVLVLVYVWGYATGQGSSLALRNTSSGRPSCRPGR